MPDQFDNLGGPGGISDDQEFLPLDFSDQKKSVKDDSAPKPDAAPSKSSTLKPEDYGKKIDDKIFQMISDWKNEAADSKPQAEPEKSAQPQKPAEIKPEPQPPGVEEKPVETATPHTQTGEKPAEVKSEPPKAEIQSDEIVFFEPPEDESKLEPPKAEEKPAEPVPEPVKEVKPEEEAKKKPVEVDDIFQQEEAEEPEKQNLSGKELKTPKKLEELEKPEPKPEPEPKKPMPKAAAKIFSKDNNFAIVLHESRLEIGMSLEDVAVQTKIKKEYVDAIEKEDFTHLPPMVYVQAYVKTLCALYGIDGKEADEILVDLRKDSKSTVPEEILQHLEDEKQVNLEEEQKVKRFVYTVTTVFAVIVILVALTVIYFFVYPGMEDNTEVPVEPGITFSEKDLNKLIPEESLEMSPLPPPGQEQN